MYEFGFCITFSSYHSALVLPGSLVIALTLLHLSTFLNNTQCRMFSVLQISFLFCSLCHRSVIRSINMPYYSTTSQHAINWPRKQGSAAYSVIMSVWLSVTLGTLKRFKISKCVLDHAIDRHL